MISVAQYNVTVCQIFQSEIVIKISAILKLFSTNTRDGWSVLLEYFLHSFSSSEEFNDDILFGLDPYIEMIYEVETTITLCSFNFVFIQFSKVLCTVSEVVVLTLLT